MEPRIFLTSDTHFGHDRDFVFAKRGFETVQEMQTSSTFLHCKVKSFLHSTVSSFLHCTVSRFLHCMVSSFLHCLVMSSLHPCQVAGEAGRYLSAENIRVLEPVGFSLE